MKDPLVSVMIPCYNATTWLASAIESALDQTWSCVEVVVVDDGSTDESVEVARCYEARGVRVLTQQHRGAGNARNTAMTVATGDFIQYLDADDLLSPDKIEAQVRLLQGSRPGLLAVSGTIHFRDGQHHQSGVAHNGWPMVDADDPVEWLVQLLGGNGTGGMVHPGAWLVPRRVADAAGEWQEFPSPDDDGEFFARVVLASSGIRRSRTGHSFYRKHLPGFSLSGASSYEHQQGALRSLDLKAKGLLARTNSTRAHRALARQYEDRAFLAYPDFPKLSKTALAKARSLGGSGNFPRFGTFRTKMANLIFGWKTVRRFQQIAGRIRKRRFGSGTEARNT